jgi:hypothetical protein
MTGEEPRLPNGFSDLEPFVADWAVAGSDARMRRRLASKEDERLAFYAAATPLLEPALAYLDQFAVDALDHQQQRLLDLILMLAHVALAVERQGANEAVHAVNHAHFTITRSTEDVSGRANGAQPY